MALTRIYCPHHLRPAYFLQLGSSMMSVVGAELLLRCFCAHHASAISASCHAVSCEICFPGRALGAESLRGDSTLGTICAWLVLVERPLNTWDRWLVQSQLCGLLKKLLSHMLHLVSVSSASDWASRRPRMQASCPFPTRRVGAECYSSVLKIGGC